MELPQYRIMQEYYRDNDTGKVFSKYVIETLKINWWRSILHLGKFYQWDPYTYEIGKGFYCFSTTVTFDEDELKEAKEYLENLKESIHIPNPI